MRSWSNLQYKCKGYLKAFGKYESLQYKNQTDFFHTLINCSTMIELKIEVTSHPNPQIEHTIITSHV